MFKPLAYTKTFAIGASVVLALTLVPMLCYYLLRPGSWTRYRAALYACIGGGIAMVFARAAIVLGMNEPSRFTGWPTAIAVGVMVAAGIYRIGRERLLPLEENVVSRGILAVYRPTLRWVLTHKLTFLCLPIALSILGLSIWLGFARVASPVRDGLSLVGIEVENTAVWQRLSQRFPGIGREFMPPLDEGTLLYMPARSRAHRHDRNHHHPQARERLAHGWRWRRRSAPHH